MSPSTKKIKVTKPPKIEVDIKEKTELQEEDDEEQYASSDDKVKVGKYEEAPKYLKDNEYIRNGYLINCHSYKLVLKSLFVWSNESVNVWTHLLGTVMSFVLFVGVYFAVRTLVFKSLTEKEFNKLKHSINSETMNFSLAVKEAHSSCLRKHNQNNCTLFEDIMKESNKFLSDLKSNNEAIQKVLKYIDNMEDLVNKLNSSNNSLLIRWDMYKDKLMNYINDDNSLEIKDYKREEIRRWPLFIMLFSAILCLGCSTTFHWFGVMNSKTFKFLSRLDYSGILFLIPGSCYPPYLYFYYCDKRWAVLYLFTITTSSLICMYFTLSPGFYLPEKRRLRGSMFLLLGISTAIPIFHLALFGDYVIGFHNKPYLCFWYWGGIAYVVGGIFYVLRVPEKYVPNKFDYIGQSHNLLHSFVLLGFIFHFFGALDSYYYRLDNKCPV